MDKAYVFNSALTISRPDLHLGAFGGVVRASPSLPVHAVSKRRVVTVVVQAVQVGAVAIVVPPGAFVPRGAVRLIVWVVVSVFGAEGHRIVPREWVTRCTCERNAQPQYYTKPIRVQTQLPTQPSWKSYSSAPKTPGNWGRAAVGDEDVQIGRKNNPTCGFLPEPYRKSIPRGSTL